MDSTTEIIEISNLAYSTIITYLDKRFQREKYTHHIEKASKKGDNYFSVVYRIIVCLHNYPGKIYKFIVKVPPANALQRKKFYATHIFLREIMAYKKFFTLIASYQKAKGLSKKHSFYEYPKYRFSLDTEFSEIIGMDDLKCEGFYLHDRFETLGSDYIMQLIKIYSKLHATTLVIKEEQPSILIEFQNIVDIFKHRANDPLLRNYLENLRNNVLHSVDQNKEKKYWIRLNRYFQNNKTIYDIMMKLLEPSEPYSVICHGDCWINNLMFKKEDNKVIDARLIDWQVMRYSSPITDLMYILMACTNRKFRREHFQSMLHSYYKSATDHMKRLGANPEKIFPRHDFELELKQKGAIGLLFAMLVMPLLIAKSEKMLNLYELSEILASDNSLQIDISEVFGGNRKEFKQRMHDIIIDTINYGFI